MERSFLRYLLWWCAVSFHYVIYCPIHKWWFTFYIRTVAFTRWFTVSVTMWFTVSLLSIDLPNATRSLRVKSPRYIAALVILFRNSSDEIQRYRETICHNLRPIYQHLHYPTNQTKLNQAKPNLAKLNNSLSTMEAHCIQSFAEHTKAVS